MVSGGWCNLLWMVGSPICRTALPVDPALRGKILPVSVKRSNRRYMKRVDLSQHA